ncbi:uncharacterized protein LOC110678446 [Aedes aegypti]|uniref:Uncharacterized protein n=1 Tax=Aedes aegypti TaxID=7159 RepID=A0A6I8TNM3_AEDAE|nr:uncharacterized protein LOC110678446 [Aedes aegypti]
MEATIQRLEQIEEQSKLWQKYCEEEKRRIEDEYNRGLAEVERAFREGSRKIKLEFQAKRETLKRQYCGEDACEKTDAKSSSKYVSSQTISPEEDISHLPSSASHPCLPDVLAEQSVIDVKQMESVLPLTSSASHHQYMVSDRDSAMTTVDHQQLYKFEVTEGASIVQNNIRCLFCEMGYSSGFCNVNMLTVAVAYICFDPGGEHSHNDCLSTYTVVHSSTHQIARASVLFNKRSQFHVNAKFVQTRYQFHGWGYVVTEFVCETGNTAIEK